MLYNLCFLYHKMSFIPHFYHFLFINKALKYKYQPGCLKVNGTEGFTANSPPLGSVLIQLNWRYVNTITLSTPRLYHMHMTSPYSGCRCTDQIKYNQVQQTKMAYRQTHSFSTKFLLYLFLCYTDGSLYLQCLSVSSLIRHDRIQFS
jgi:hypothetical protein